MQVRGRRFKCRPEEKREKVPFFDEAREARFCVASEGRQQHALREKPLDTRNVDYQLGI